MKKLVFFGFTVLFLSCSKPVSKDEKLLEKIDSLQVEITELKEANDTLSNQLIKKVFVTRSYPPYFDTIAQPENFLLKKLQQQPDLIPKEAVLGGEMRFTSVSFINENYIITEFEDGHILGKALFSYSMSKTGELNFKLVTQL